MMLLHIKGGWGGCHCVVGLPGRGKEAGIESPPLLTYYLLIVEMQTKWGRILQVEYMKLTLGSSRYWLPIGKHIPYPEINSTKTFIALAVKPRADV